MLSSHSGRTAMSIKERIEKAKKLLKKVAVGTALFGLGATAGSCDNKENSGLSSLNEEELKEYANTHKLDTTELYIRDPGATYLSREEYNKQIREFKKEHQIKKSIEAAEDAKISKKEQTSSASKDNKTDDDNKALVSVIPTNTPSNINAVIPASGIATAQPKNSIEDSTTAVSLVRSDRNCRPPIAYNKVKNIVMIKPILSSRRTTS